MDFVSEFNPYMAVIYYHKQKNRHEKSHSNIMEQEWFQGVFSDASDNNYIHENKSTKVCYF